VTAAMGGGTALWCRRSSWAVPDSPVVRCTCLDPASRARSGVESGSPAARRGEYWASILVLCFPPSLRAFLSPLRTETPFRLAR